MNLNSEGRIAQFYKWSYCTESLPQDFCTFFWKLLFALALFPVTWAGYPIGEIPGGDLGMRVLFGCFGWFALFAAALLLIAVYERPAVVFGSLFAAIALGALVFGLFVLRTRLIDREGGFVSETIDIIKTRKASFKDKYCPRITWK